MMKNGNSPIFVSLETSAFSGATLLSFLLGTHPHIATVGEMSGLITNANVDEYLCSCGKKIKCCEFWASVKTAMANRGFEFDVANFETQFNHGPRLMKRLREGFLPNRTLDTLRNTILFALPGEGRQNKAVVDRNIAFIESVLEVTNKNVFVDSSKGSFRLKALYRFSSFDMRAIHLVRDVRGVVASTLRRGLSPNAASAAQDWVRTHRRTEITLKPWPKEKYIRVRYEDVCLNPESTLEKIYDFCEVDPDSRITDFRKLSHHIIGNEMRLRSESEITLDERWKEQLTPDQLKEIEQIAGPVARRYGYFS